MKLLSGMRIAALAWAWKPATNSATAPWKAAPIPIFALLVCIAWALLKVENIGVN